MKVFKYSSFKKFTAICLVLAISSSFVPTIGFAKTIYAQSHTHNELTQVPEGAEPSPTPTPSPEGAEPSPTPTPSPEGAEPSPTPAPSPEGAEPSPEPALFPLALVPEETYLYQIQEGDTVILSAKLNREDVAVSYQWQKLKKENSQTFKLDKVLHDYNDSPTFYNFPLSNKSESEVLKEDAGRTWSGIELYHAAKQALEAIGENTDDLSFEWRTQNFALDSFSIRAEKENDIVRLYAEKEIETDGKKAVVQFVGQKNENGKFEFQQASTEQQKSTVTHEWLNIDSATENTLSITVQKEDYTSEYRCVITVLDEDYKKQSLEILKEENSIPDETLQNAPQYLYTPIYSFAPKYDESMIVPESTWYSSYESLGGKNIIGNPQLSSDFQWIQGLTGSYEYITKDAYDRVSKWLNEGKISIAQADLYWTRLLNNGFNGEHFTNVLDENGFPTGKSRRYRGFDLVNGKLPVNSQWYGKTVYFRPDKDGKKNWQDTGTTIEIPAYTDIVNGGTAGKLYKKAISFLNPFVYDTGSMYGEYLATISSSKADSRGQGWLDGTDMNIQVYDILADYFNQDPARYLVDAEGNYRMDSVGWGVCTGQEPDISGKAYWILKDYLANGYGFLVGHDTLYSYAAAYQKVFGTDLDETIIDKNDGITWYHDLYTWLPQTRGYRYNDTMTEIIEYNDKRGGHFYLNQLLGSNKGTVLSGTVSPKDAPSLILSSDGKYGYYQNMDMYGGTRIGLATNDFSHEQAILHPKYRTPTNYPYNVFQNGSDISVDITHTNNQYAFGTVWANYKNNEFGQGIGTIYPNEIIHSIDGLNGTNNFYLTGSGNFLMNQIGHLPTNKATIDEAKLFANSVAYVSQRKQCEVCAANQNNQQDVHFVHRINSANADEVLKVLQDGGNFWYPLGDCYMLTDDIVLPEDWTPIKNFNGHWNADVYTVQLNSKNTPLFENSVSQGEHGWNLGTDYRKGVQNVFDNNKRRTTGVARVLGDLNVLFGTDNLNYAGYTVKILGKDNTKNLPENEVYSCVVNSDSKYVISNLPTIYDVENHTGVLRARVYDRNGQEVIKYGHIFANVPLSFWNTNMTTPLYLGSVSAEPVKDFKTKESAQATFLAVATSDDTDITIKGWEYRENTQSEWKTVPQEWNPIYSQKRNLDGILTSVQSTLSFDDVKPQWNNYEFRCIFESPVYGTWSSYNYFKEGATVSLTKTNSSMQEVKVAKNGFHGKLQADLWVVATSQSDNKTVYDGQNVSFSSTGYSFAESEENIKVEWQYSTKQFNSNTGQNDLVWHSLDTQNPEIINEFGKAVDRQSETRITTVDMDTQDATDIVHLLNTIENQNLETFKNKVAFYKIETTLYLKDVDFTHSDTNFRVKYTATTKHGTVYQWYSNLANNYDKIWLNHDLSICQEVPSSPVSKENYSNVLTVLPRKLNVITTPSANFEAGKANVDTFTPDEYGQFAVLDNPSGSYIDNRTVAYQATIYYLPNSEPPEVQWQYQTFKDRTPKEWNDAVAKSLFPDFPITVTQEQTEPVLVQTGEYQGYYSFTSTMKITNLPMIMYDSSSLTKYFFRLSAKTEYQTVKTKYQEDVAQRQKVLLDADKWGGLALDYSIGIQHNGVFTYGGVNSINGQNANSIEDIIKITKHQSSSTWKYPQLAIHVPQGKEQQINTVFIFMDKERKYNPKDKIQITNLSEIESYGITIKRNEPHFIMLSATVSNQIHISTWQNVLRNNIEFITYDKVDYTDINGNQNGVPIQWIVDENRYDNVVIDEVSNKAFQIFSANEPVDWGTAAQLATQKNLNGIGGQLAKAETDKENALIKQLVGNNRAWLGGKNENGWKWVDGKPIQNDGWQSNAAKNNAFLYMNGQAGWNSTNGYTIINETYTLRNMLHERNYNVTNPTGNNNNKIYFKTPNGFKSNGVAGTVVDGGQGIAYVTSQFAVSNNWQQFNSEYRTTPANIRIPFLGIQTNGIFNRGDMTQTSIEGNRVYQLQEPITFHNDHYYYMQLVVDSFGDRNGQIGGGIMTDSGWLTGTNWLQEFGESGGKYQEFEFAFKGNGEVGIPTFWLTGNYKKTNNIQDNPYGDIYQYAIVDLTEAFGNNETLRMILQESGNNLDNPSTIVNWFEYVRNNNLIQSELFINPSESPIHPAQPPMETAAKGFRNTANFTYHKQINENCQFYVVEYPLDALSIKGTNHSATDSDRIGTNVDAHISNKTLTVQIVGNEKVYDGNELFPKNFVVTGSVGANMDLLEISYRVDNGYENWQGQYPERTVKGSQWNDTNIKNSTTYIAQVTLTQEAIQNGWKIDTKNSQTTCKLVVHQRPIDVFSHNNNKVYDGNHTGTINNIIISPTSQQDASGIVNNDIVKLTATSVKGFYVDKNNRFTSHNSKTNNDDNPYKMQRDTQASPLGVKHAKDSDPYHNYFLRNEVYSGAISQKGLYLHSLYLEEKTKPRNVKKYDGLNSAIVSDIIIDGIVQGDTISLKKETLQGNYTTHEAGEPLNEETGLPYDDRLYRLSENRISLEEKPVLQGNKYNDYFIEREEYSGGIYREMIETRVKHWKGIFGTGMENAPWHSQKPYTSSFHGNPDDWLQLDGLKHEDELHLTDKSYFKVDGLGKNAKIEKNTPVGRYIVRYKGLTEPNYPILKNYFIKPYDGYYLVSPREIVIQVNNADKMNNTENPSFYSTFYLRQDDNSLLEIGTDAVIKYQDMPLAIEEDTIQSVVKVKMKNSQDTTDLIMSEEKKSNIPYFTLCELTSEPIYDTGEDMNFYRCEFCEKYHGFELGTDHWNLGGYEVKINQNTQDNVLQVAFVENALQQKVQNYSLTTLSGSLFVHPNLRFQLRATVPMYVCMYGYRGNGEIIEPTNYGITNFSNGAIEIQKITVSNDGWEFVSNSSPQKLKAGQLFFNMNNTILKMGENKPKNIENWIIEKDSSENQTGTFKQIPITAYMAGGNINASGEHFVSKITYTIGEVATTLPQQEINQTAPIS